MLLAEDRGRIATVSIKDTKEPPVGNKAVLIVQPRPLGAHVHVCMLLPCVPAAYLCARLYLSACVRGDESGMGGKVALSDGCLSHAMRHTSMRHTRVMVYASSCASCVDTHKVRMTMSIMGVQEHKSQALCLSLCLGSGLG